MTCKSGSVQFRSINRIFNWRRQMRTSLNSASTLLLAIAISAGILLYPAGASCIDILQKDGDSKIINPDIEPNIRCGEPGDDPTSNLGPLGSSLGTSIDAQQPDLPNSDSRGNKTARSRYMQLLFFYLRNLTHGPFRH